MYGDTADGSLVASAQDPGADFHGCDSEALAGADRVRPDPVGGGRGVRRDRVLMAALLSPVKDAERPVNNGRDPGRSVICARMPVGERSDMIDDE